MLMQIRDRLKERVGIYGTGWDPASAMGLLLPILGVIMLSVVGFGLVLLLQAI